MITAFTGRTGQPDEADTRPHGGHAEVFLAAIGIGVAGRVFSELGKHPGVEDRAEPRLAQIDLSVRVLAKTRLYLLPQCLSDPSEPWSTSFANSAARSSPKVPRTSDLTQPSRAPVRAQHRWTMTTRRGPEHYRRPSARTAWGLGASTSQQMTGSRLSSIHPQRGSTHAASPGDRRPSHLTVAGSLTKIEVMTTQSLAAVKAHFSQVIDEVAGTHERVTVTRNGSPVAVILAVEDYESLMETLEILSDPRARSDIRQAEEEMSGGEVYDEADVRAALAARRR